MLSEALIAHENQFLLESLSSSKEFYFFIAFVMYLIIVQPIRLYVAFSEG